LLCPLKLTLTNKSDFIRKSLNYALKIIRSIFFGLFGVNSHYNLKNKKKSMKIKKEMVELLITMKFYTIVKIPIE
jgi:hypothetical protein